MCLWLIDEFEIAFNQNARLSLEDLRTTEAHRLGDDVLIHMAESVLLLDTFRPVRYVTTNTTAAAAWRFM